DSNYGDLYKKGAGYKLSIHDLARITIEQSDNTALNGVQDIIKPHVSTNSPNSAYSALDVEFTDSSSTDLQLSARSYTSFLKCLYFACYLSTDSSQEIMNYLTHSTEGKSNKLKKYLPNNVKIAHKIGVAGNMSQADCGVVYVPNRNYALCVMLEESEDRASEVIAQVSKKVYDYVDKL
ncbi:MAG TPA: serine hydrolase, partial [Candidatus Saccharibacteria bacterium]|nr:serine hydrolase [Candidatus Saccharibacteria bacterium]